MATTEEESDKIHGDKLEHLSEQKPTSPSPHSALDQLEIPAHENPRTDGGTKLHGDKLDTEKQKP